MRSVVSLQVAVLALGLCALGSASVPGSTADVDHINSLIRIGAWKPVMEQIKQQPILAQSKDTMGATPLHFAAIYGHVQLGRWLISKGAKVNSIDYCGQSPLYMAAEAGRAAMCQMLIGHGAKINQPDQDMYTPLHAVMNARCANILLAAGANIAAKDNHGLTPIFYAVSADRADVVKVLINSRANLDVRDRLGDTPLTWAKQRQHVTITKQLSRAGARQ